MTDSSPSRRTVDEVAAPYANYLVRVPPVVPGVCAVCHGAVSGYRTCYQCMEAKRTLRSHVANSTGFVSLAPRGEQFARELAMYKDERVSEPHRNRMVSGLAAVLWKWLGRHERCLGAPLEFDRFDVMTTVPSTSGRDDHPLRRLVAGIVTGSADHHEDLLMINRPDLDQRVQASDRYRASRDLEGARALVVDDTWTTGAHAQSASAALKAAGASRVGVVVLGRWLNPGFADNAAWLAEHRKPGWDWDRCSLE